MEKVQKYIKIKKHILDGIAENIWVTNGKLPSEDDFCAVFSVSRGTVRQAINELVNENILYKVHGKGTFVKPKIIDHEIDSHGFLNFIDELVEKKIPFETVIIGKHFIPMIVEAGKYFSPQETELFYIERIRKNEDTPIMLCKNYVPKSIFRGIEKADFASGSLYHIIESDFNVKVDHVKRTFRAVKVSADISETLGLSRNTPLMYVNQIAFDTVGRCIDYAEIWINSNVIQLSVTIKRS